MKNYVVGLRFNNHDEVVLILKNRPTWQKGLLNGVGGQIGEDESPLEAMRREFLEETGELVKNWTHFLTRSDTMTNIYFFKSFGAIDAETQTDEKIFVLKADSLHKYHCVSDLSWIVPLALKESGHAPVILEHTKD